MLYGWKQKLTSGWGLMRLLRLGLAILVLYEAWKNAELLFTVLGGILLFQSVFDVGCCGSGACDINPPKIKERSEITEPDEITFREIK